MTKINIRDFFVVTISIPLVMQLTVTEHVIDW